MLLRTFNRLLFAPSAKNVAPDRRHEVVVRKPCLMISRALSPFQDCIVCAPEQHPGARCTLDCILQGVEGIPAVV
jgi:hypothetical protein